ncbi:MAG: hypothetical protein IPN88_09815 [Bacteroidetes bacterium]|nr:hypothetical protein [Bacteroidota bacterium]
MEIHQKGKGASIECVTRKINFISMVRGKEDSTVIQFKRKFDELNKKQKANEHAKHALVDIERIIDIWEAHGINAALLSIRKQ